MRETIELVISRAKYAAIGAAIGGGLGGLISRNAASTGAAAGALIGATAGEKRIAMNSFVAEVKEKKSEYSPISLRS